MLVNADIYVKDTPGQLVSSLEPLSVVNANIIGVVHSREQMVDGRIAVNITFDIEPDMADKLKSIWKSKDVIVAKFGSVVTLYGIQYMVIGNVTASAMESMLTEAKEIVDIESSDIRLTSKSSGKSTAMVTASVKSAEAVPTLDKFLSKECTEKGFTYIRGVEQ